MANSLRFSCKGRVGFIDWLDGLTREHLGKASHLRVSGRVARLGSRSVEEGESGRESNPPPVNGLTHLGSDCLYHLDLMAAGAG